MTEPPCSRKVRVLLADDSAVMRSLLRMVLEPQPCFEIVAAATNGREALAAFERLRPDVVLLDIEMPGMNGLEALSGIRRHDRKVPILMCSTLTWRGARITLEALARGATDYVTKPGAQTGLRQGVETLTRDLVPKILALFPRNPPRASAEARPVIPSIALPPPVHAPKVVVIGVSTGGPAALEVLLPKIPAAFPLPILIVQHMPRLFTGLLADRLNGLCALRVREAAPDVRPEPGVVDIARGDWHLELTRDFRLRLHQSDPENFCRPSVDVLFRSAALACTGRVLGIVLTGMGSDGLAGCRAIRAAGGAVLAQDAATSVIWGMPGAVAQAGLASKILPLDAIPGEMLRLVTPSNARPPQAARIAL
ncbi:MAG: chemotaxis response regulator protein-glutamate methylesterase [Acidobacteriaceae bacterium]